MNQTSTTWAAPQPKDVVVWTEARHPHGKVRNPLFYDRFGNLYFNLDDALQGVARQAVTS